MKGRLVGKQKHIKRFDLRKFKGRVFFTTDIHGHFDLLHEKLREVAFNADTDILFVGADMCDRGPDSKYVLDYIYEPWLHSIQGNHEAMLIDAYENPDCRQAYQMLFYNGGEWFYDIDEQHQKAIYQAFKELPLSIELLLPNNVKVGIVHADCPFNDWNKWTNITKAELEWNGKATAHWSRRNYDRGVPVNVKGVDFVLTGHTPTKSGEIEILGNQVFADLGSFFRGKLGIIEINKSFMEKVNGN